MDVKEFFSRYWIMAAMFALLNVIMYVTITKFWIGELSFLPMIGILGKDGAPTAFLFAFIVNIGVIVGAFIGAQAFGEFMLRIPKRENIWKAVLGGAMIGVGLTLAPGTCTTAFVTGIPFLSVSSFLSAIGIVLGAFIVYKWRGYE